MNIDKSKLKMGTWYEDKNGNVIKQDNDSLEIPKEALTYHALFPLEITEYISGIYTNKDTCRHPLKCRKRTGGWKKGIKGCKCNACGKEKVGKKHIPFFMMKWSEGGTIYPIMDGHTTINAMEECVVAMVNSGDYTLREAIVVSANVCERCMNVLLYKYLNGKDGYEEYSEEWKQAHTVCDFCRGEK